MKSSAKKIELASVDDLFSTEEGRQDAKLEKIQEIPLSELHPFKNHPFKVKDDEAMMETADSIKQYGVLVPAIARPDPEGGYELVAGHRRHRASELAEKETMPVIVRDLDDDAATIIMVDSNLQRESLLPSERAFAYKMKLDAIKHQGARTDLTSAQVGPKLTAAEKIAEKDGAWSLITGESVGQVASQTMQGIYAINAVCNMPVLRPLAGMDKQEIINIGTKIGTYDISIRPYEDCCTIFVAKHPQIKPRLNVIERIERKLTDLDKYLEEAVENAEIIEL